MKRNFRWMAAALMALTLVACGGDDPEPAPAPGPETPPEPPVEEVVTTELTLNTVVQTQYQHGEEKDLFYLALATGEVVFDDAVFTYRTIEEGYVMNICLYTAPMADPTAPVLPAGEYELDLAKGVGSWSGDPDQNLLVGFTVAEGVSQDVPTEGCLVLSVEGGSYTLQAEFKVDDKPYKATYTGELHFAGLPSTITESLDIELIGGQAVYQGQDVDYPELGFVQLELWDAEPDSETGRVEGHFLKLKLFMELPEQGFRGVPAGRYPLSEEAAPFKAVPGYDDGINIPTGCYISERRGSELNLAVFHSGEILVAEDGCVSMELWTNEEVLVKARLATPMDLVDLTGGFAPSTGELSTLQQDVNFTFGTDTMALLLDYGDFYGNETRSVVIQLLDEASLQGLVLDLILPEAERYAPLPEGTFTLDKGYRKPFTFVAGGEMMGQPTGSYYCNFTLPDYYIGEIFAPLASGEAQVTLNSDGSYTIEVEMLDDAKEPHAVRGSFTGTIENYEE